MKLDRGAIVVVDLDPSRGHEQRGQRPCLVVSDPEEALRHLGRAHKERDMDLFLVATDPRFAALHDDPRFGALLHDVGLR